MAGLVPATPKIGRCALLNEIAGTSPAMTAHDFCSSYVVRTNLL
jgi:hypothetical protein